MSVCLMYSNPSSVRLLSYVSHSPTPIGATMKRRCYAYDWCILRLMHSNSSFICPLAQCTRIPHFSVNPLDALKAQFRLLNTLESHVPFVRRTRNQVSSAQRSQIPPLPLPRCTLTQVPHTQTPSLSVHLTHLNPSSVHSTHLNPSSVRLMHTLFSLAHTTHSNTLFNLLVALEAHVPFA